MPVYLLVITDIIMFKFYTFLNLPVCIDIVVLLITVGTPIILVNTF